MKRTLFISFLFCALFALLCLTSCGGPDQCVFKCDSITVEEYEDTGCSCQGKEPASKGETKLSGCHIANSCIDCFYFPTACGYYDNDLESVSCVVCGWDCTFLECYGDSALKEEKVEYVSNVETRYTVTATEGVDYTVDSMKVSMYSGGYQALEDGFDISDMDDWQSFIGAISMLNEEVQLQFTLEYTALTELSSTVFYGDIIYDGYNWSNYTDGFRAVNGNTDSDLRKDRNIQPGKHIARAVISLNFYEMRQLEDITSITFSATKYGGEQ